MSTFWLTFRLADDATYSERYDTLIDTIQDMQSLWWVESTSFIVFEAAGTINDVAAAIKQAINPQTDMALLGMPNYKSARLLGASTDPDLFTLMPFTKKA